MKWQKERDAHALLFLLQNITQNKYKDFHFHFSNENKIHIYTTFIIIFINPSQGSSENKPHFILTTLSLQVFILSFPAPLFAKSSINVKKLDNVMHSRNPRIHLLSTTINRRNKLNIPFLPGRQTRLTATRKEAHITVTPFPLSSVPCPSYSEASNQCCCIVFYVINFLF